MKKVFFVSLAVSFSALVMAQGNSADVLTKDFIVEKENKTTSVKNQAMTGTCWSFSTTALVESQFLKNSKSDNIDLSEMFTVKNIYVEKAKNYIMRQGAAQFGEGGLGHDVIRAIATYGAMPEQAYSGLAEGKKMHNHARLTKELKTYLDSMLKKKPLPLNWLDGYKEILDKELGKTPESFDYNGKTYTAKTFADEVLHFKADDYVNLTSFTDHPYYSAYIINIPDNFSNGSYYNLPLDEFVSTAKEVIKKGYTFMWDADVSNAGFRQENGLALNIAAGVKVSKDSFTTAYKEDGYNAARRQQLFDELITQDDHLMQAAGLVKTKDGREFFTVKNSWGEQGPYKGFIMVSEPYFGINTVSLVVPKAALGKELLAKLKLN
ncbi:MAG: C1 family peptidase [Ferruginibacter sp.]